MPTLLNVDDHEVARYARSRILMNAGFVVREAGTGAEAMRLVAQHRPDLVLLDVHLPDLNGVEVCRQLKQTQGISLMILQISASALTASHAKQALDAGADGYLMEPVDADVLVATVKALLRLHQAEQSVLHANRQLEIVNKELRRSNRDLQQFAYAASHDLQEPLRTISTFTQLIEAELSGDLTERHKNYFARVLDGTGRMGALIRDLLAYSQVGWETRPTAVVPLDGVLASAVDNLGHQVAESGCIIVTPQPLPSVLGDAPNLVSVFYNLLSNSIKYRKPGQGLTVEISAESSSPREWTICVKDNGSGIAPQYHAQIFEPFTRLHGSEIAGTGIGLALCRKIVESAGGRIWVESAVDQGATFCFTLPAA
jgi:two-component system, sensor histidine kinase and response regulator